MLAVIRDIQGGYNFAGQYQQSPSSPLGGGMIKAQWFETYRPERLPKEFELVVQSWDTVKKSTELSDYSVCTTWGEAQGTSVSPGRISPASRLSRSSANC